MVGRLVALKWRLLRNGLRTGPQRAIGLPAVTLALGGVGIWSALTFLETVRRLSPEAAGELSLWVVVLGWPAWMVLPVLFFPLDEPLDPARLVQLPLSPPALLTGLAGAGLITPPVLVIAAVLVADLRAFSASPLAWAAGLIVLLLFSAGGQAFGLLMSGIFRSRRGRDLAVLMVVGIGLTGFVVFELIRVRIATLGLEAALLAHPLSGIARLLPPAAAQDVVLRIARGDVAGSILSLTAAGAWLLVVGGLWWVLLVWVTTTPEAGPLGRRPRGTGLAGRARAWTPALVVARKELRSYLRDPRLRAVWTGAVIFPGILVVALVLGITGREALRSPWLVTATPLVPLLVGLPVTLNQLGWERRSADFLFSLPVRAADVLGGKNLAAASGLAVLTALAGIAAAALAGGWDRLWTLVPLTGAVIGCQLAIGNLVSVLAPLRLPPPGSDLFAQASEEGCLAFVAQLVGFTATALLLVPVMVATVLVELGALPPAGLVVGGPIWGGLVFWVGFRAARGILDRRFPEVAAAVRPA